MCAIQMEASLRAWCHFPRLLLLFVVLASYRTCWWRGLVEEHDCDAHRAASCVFMQIITLWVPYTSGSEEESHEVMADMRAIW
jgi:hypothetical protein